MKKDIHFTGISGSLQKDSFITYLPNNLVSLRAGDVALKIISIADLPLSNTDLVIPAGKERRATATNFRNKLSTTDGLLIVSPEYKLLNYRWLKNPSDWASRGEDSPLLKNLTRMIIKTRTHYGYKLKKLE